ncbi:cap-specific mRNA (nucleoside-2'-O-)-methyltransferase 1-like [Chelonus insularis]|uniref:cap-specific mRNA (nucleoside-2'-O-)-methyltransferase 1-like n=1 Tax=Chelonus insularis TaxID=460826 RepID=UPI001588E307|nr:cap-specific mRNA (nucleoside-2'-O-)-methyltransferase 1-like [Chelonus insularis]
MNSSRLSTDHSDSSSPTYDDGKSSSFNDSSFKRSLSESDESDQYSPKRPHFSFDNEKITLENYAESEKRIASNIGERLMQKMGYSEGKGLGKYGQGRLNPVEAFQQKGRRGLGHDNTKLVEAKLKWDPSAEVVGVEENMLWIDCHEPPLTANDVETWMGLGPRKETIDDEITFCDAQIVEQVVSSKSVFDSLDKNEMRRARTRSNPYETIRGAFFLNRAAVKMANIDRACDFMFTQPSVMDKNELLYFADVCAGPGGFSEYVLWRKKWEAKGFGFTLKDSNDFKLEDFYAGPPESFHTFYGPKKDGNVYDPENQQAFRKLIMNQTRGRGVHFMMSDGGFSVEGQENIQEILSKQLYLCQCLVALMIVRDGGHFVTKLFDIFTPFSAGLVYLMYRCFRRVCIFKPNTSRPANSERYLICQEKLPNTDDIMNYLFQANLKLLKNNKNLDVMQLVPEEVLLNDLNFIQYLRDSNYSLGSKQVVGLLKIAAYCEDPSLLEHRQAQMRKECLEHWKLPDHTRTRPRDMKPEIKLSSLNIYFQEIAKQKGKILSFDNLEATILNPPCDWFCIPCECPDYTKDDNIPTLYFSMGGTKVYKLTRSSWQRVDSIRLPPDTLIYAEKVKEYRGEFKNQSNTHALHIIDAWLLGSQDISQMFLPERQNAINKFCESLWSPNNSSFMRIRPKPMFSLDDDLKSKLNLKLRTLKNGKTVKAFHPGEPPYSQEAQNNNVDRFFFVPNSLMFLKSTSPPWSLHLSKRTGVHYFFNSRENIQVYNDRRPKDVAAHFSKTYENRVIWYWQQNPDFNLNYLCHEIKRKCAYTPTDRLPY